MVSAMMAQALNPVLTSMAEIRTRIIGMDGNGTGREGVLQRQDKSIARLDDGQVFIIEKLGGLSEQLHTLTTRQETWSKKKFWNWVKWGIPVIITLIALLLTYVTFRASSNRPIASIPTVSQNHTTNAEVQ